MAKNYNKRDFLKVFLLSAIPAASGSKIFNYFFGEKTATMENSSKNNTVVDILNGESDILKLLDKTQISKDFSDDLPRQWTSIQEAYRNNYPNNRSDFSFFLDTNLCEEEIVSAKNRFIKGLQQKFSASDINQMNQFFETELGKKVLEFTVHSRLEMRNERTIISKNIGSKLEAVVQSLNSKKLS